MTAAKPITATDLPKAKPEALAPAIVPPKRLLLGPGPSPVHPRILEAMGQPTVGHLDPYYLQLMDAMQGMLRKVFQTANPMTLAISGTGSAGMEALLANLIEPGDRVMIGVNGVFGGRMVEVSKRCGAKVEALHAPWGQTFALDVLEAGLKKHRPKVLGIVMAETSTGAAQEIQELGALCARYDTLLLVDAVTALGGMPLDVDGWGIDAIYSGTQKCLGCPPGLAPISVGPRALEAIQTRKTSVQSWYLDLSLLASYWGQDRVYHHTAPINMTYGLYEALRLVLEEGLPAVWQRHQVQHQALRAGLEAMELALVPDPTSALPMLNAVHLPQGIEDAPIRLALLQRFGIEIGGGLGVFAGKAWRIGLMGEGARAASVKAVLEALQTLLAEAGHAPAQQGKALVAAEAVWTAAKAA